MANPKVRPTEKEIDTDTDTFKAMVMILRADTGRYADLQKTLFKGVYKCRDEFPTTVTAAYICYITSLLILHPIQSHSGMVDSDFAVIAD